jgi:hypothetical protein
MKITYSAPMPAAAMTTTMKSTTVEPTEVARSKTMEIRWMSELVVFPGMMDYEGASPIPTTTPVRSVRIAIAIAVARPASAADNTK